jgi:hypothetical protein
MDHLPEILKVLYASIVTGFILFLVTDDNVTHLITNLMKRFKKPLK